MAYAAARYIEVIPEIEFPAHSDEVFIGYPELCCSGKPYTSGEFCVGNPATFEFMDGVLTEVMELFPSRGYTSAATRPARSPGKPAPNASCSPRSWEAWTKCSVT